MAQTFEAKLDEWTLNLLDISDSVNASVVRHEFVNTDGAVLQHLGNRPKEIKFKTYWYGTSYKDHFEFLNIMSRSGEDSFSTHVLIHPQYGYMIGKIESLVVVHDDTQDYVTIDISFVEQDIQNTTFVTKDNLAIIDSMSVSQLNNALTSSAASLASAGHSSILGKIIDSSQKLATQFDNISQSTRVFLNECDTNLAKFDNFLVDITAPLNAIDNAVNFVSDVPSRILGSINNACNRIMGSLSSLSNLPVQFVNNMVSNVQNLYNLASGTNVSFFQTQIKSIAAGSILRQSGVLLKADEDKRAIQIAKEQKQSFDAAGNLINEITFEPIMSIQDLDIMMYDIRMYCQEAILLNRENQMLKNMASALISYVDDLKLRRLSIKTMTVNNIPMHMLLLQLGFAYNMAERVLALNPQIHNPTFCEGPIKVYVNG